MAKFEKILTMVRSKNVGISEEDLSQMTEKHLRNLVGVGSVFAKILQDGFIQRYTDSPEEKLFRSLRSTLYTREFDDTIQNAERCLTNIRLHNIPDSEKIFELIESSFCWLSKLGNNEKTKIQILSTLFDELKECESTKTFDPLQKCPFLPESIEKDPMRLNAIGTIPRIAPKKLKFKAIDSIALRQGWWSESTPARIQHYIRYLFTQYVEKRGHSYFTQDDFSAFIQSNKDLDKDLAMKQIKLSTNVGILLKLPSIQTTLKKRYITTDIYEKEQTLAKNILEWNEPSHSDRYDLDTSYLDYDPSQEQLDAIDGMSCHHLSLLIGGGGTGKTDCVVKARILNEINRSKQSHVIIATPTHSAKKTIQGAIGNHPSIHYATLQSLIFQPHNSVPSSLSRFLSENTVTYIIIDEMSMINTMDLYNFFKICTETYNGQSEAKPKPKPNICCVGDDAQLEPVGLGTPFISMIKYKKIPTFRLTQNFRSKGSDILKFYTHIIDKLKRGEFISLHDITPEYKNVHFLGEDKGSVEERVKKLIENFREDGCIPHGTESDISDTFQIISHENQTCRNLCPIVRNCFPDLFSGGEDDYDVRDPIQMRKNTMVYKNGDDAIIVGIDRSSYMYEGKKIDKSTYTVKLRDQPPSDSSFWEKVEEYDDKTYIHNEDGTISVQVSNEEIKPVFAKTIHSAQGEGFSRVIYIIDTTNLALIHTKSISTALTRAKKRLYLICKDFKLSKKTDPPIRNCLLSEFLENGTNPLPDTLKSIQKPHTQPNDRTTSISSEASDLTSISSEASDLTSIGQSFIMKSRKAIPKALRNQVYFAHPGNSYRKGRCFVCKRYICLDNFHAGHIIPESKGGKTIFDNLKAICMTCNDSMGNENMLKWKKTYYPNM